MSSSPANYQFHLPDMSCGHCVAAVTSAVSEVDPGALLSFDRPGRRLEVQASSLGREQLAAALAEAGYPEAPAAA